MGLFPDTGVQYCWGKGDMFPVSIWGVSMLFGALVTAIVYAYTAPEKASSGVAALAGDYTLTGDHIIVDGGKVAENMVNALGGTVLVTLGWVLGFFNTIYHQIQLKLWGNFNPNAGKLGERMMMNGLEQGAGAFLILLWLHALFVDTKTSETLGWLYVVTRWLYSPLYAWYGHFTILVEFATMPNYTVLAYFFFGLAATCGLNDGLIPRLNDMNPVVLFLAFFGLFLVFFVLWAVPIGLITAIRNNHMNPFPEEDLENGEEDDE